ncbi:MAG: hypothetical protein ABSE64_07180 [Vulcanimicrobiaceae bacterium]|jgi:hypothetical protein
MNYDDEALERALNALSLEDAPPDLHSRIVAAIAQRPEPAFRAWELWVVGIAFAVCTWLILAISRAPSDVFRVATQHVEAGIMAIVTPPAVYWLLLGVVTAVVVQARREPRPRIRAY